MRELRARGWREDTQQGTLATGVARLRGRWVSCRLAVRPGMEWLAAGTRRDYGFPKASAGGDGEAARRAGDPSHQSEDPPPDRHGPLAQTIRAVQRARLCAITWTASQAPLAAKRTACGSARRHLRSRMAFSTSAWRRDRPPVPASPHRGR